MNIFFCGLFEYFYCIVECQYFEQRWKWETYTPYRFCELFLLSFLWKAVPPQCSRFWTNSTYRWYRYTQICLIFGLTQNGLFYWILSCWYGSDPTCKISFWQHSLNRYNDETLYPFFAMLRAFSNLHTYFLSQYFFLSWNYSLLLP